MAKKFFIETYGCQMNKADSASIRALLLARGLEYAEAAFDADIVILNTCAVRAHAEERVYGRLGYYKHLKESASPGLTVALTGCLARFSKERLEHDFEIDIIADVYSQEDLADILAEREAKERTPVSLYREEGYEFKESQRDPAFPYRAYVSISHGCDNWCSYCIVPYVRGRMISRPKDEIIQDIRRLVDEGVKEITLLGQNVNSYGEDIGEAGFVPLLEEADSYMNGAWLRFLTSHPKDFSETLADALVSLPSVCEHLHLPLQSGNNRMLRLMRRRYTREDYLEKVASLRSRLPGFALSTDVITGFADESEEEFADTLSLMDEVRFEDAFMYRYSERKGSLAQRENIPYDEEAGSRRLGELIERQRTWQRQTIAQFVGTKMDVLIEQKAKDGVNLLGRSRENRMVLVPPTMGEIGSIVSITPQAISGTTLSV